MSLETIRRHLPDGRVIDGDEFETRHRLITVVLLLHGPVVFGLGLAMGFAVWHALLESLAVVLALAALYVDVRPFVAAVVYAVVHHAGLSLYDSALVFEHQRGQESPFVWTAVHVFFVVLLIGALSVNWFTLQATHERWLRATSEQEELLRRQAALTEESPALADRHQASLERRQDQTNRLAAHSAELVAVSDSVRDTIGSTTNAMGDMNDSAARVSHLVREVVGLSISSPPSLTRPTSWLSTPRSRPSGPARPGRASPWSPRRSRVWPSGHPRPPNRSVR